ncbi:hypothetical protein [Nonomuraea sp. NPDC050786]|uniref:hypothetical protein n=1 Tax=Nonomuraea sp. NPDC050786 TaxID=3154840 RepID=UPI0033FE565E
MDHIETGESTTYGRSMRVLAVGDTLDELELSALDKVRAVFGPAARLEVVRNYDVYSYTPGDFSSFSEVRESGKTLYTHITVREVIA